MQRQILINVMIFIAYALNLPLNTQRPHHRSHRWKTLPGFWLMAVARYIALPLISRYLSMDPTNRDISGLHCIEMAPVVFMGAFLSKKCIHYIIFFESLGKFQYMVFLL